MYSVINKFLKKKPTSLSLKHFNLYYKNNKEHNMIIQSNFIRKELPIRFSHSINILNNLPNEFKENFDIKSINNLYLNSLDSILNINEITNKKELDNFFNCISDIKLKKNHIEDTISGSILNYNKVTKKFNNDINNFFLLRISIHSLINQHINIFSLNCTDVKKCKINDIIHKVCNEVNGISNFYYNKEIDFRIRGDENIELLYIYPYIYYILMEILKNSSVSHLINKINKPININFFSGEEDIIIKISDNGLGFTRSNLKDVLTYSYSTYNEDIITEEYEIINIPIMTGFGVGLPLSKLYCEYLGGNMHINPIDGVGTDIYIYLKKNEINECFTSIYN